MDKMVFHIINKYHLFIITHAQGFTTIATHNVDKNGKPGDLISEASLRGTESRMLMLLLKNKGNVVTKDMIMEVVWKNKFVTENSIRQVIFNLRSHLNDKDKPHRLLLNARGVGYILLIQNEQQHTNNHSAPYVPLSEKDIHSDTSGTAIKSSLLRITSFISSYLTRKRTVKNTR